MHREMSANPGYPSSVQEEALSCKLLKAEVLISPLSDPTTGLNMMHVLFLKRSLMKKLKTKWTECLESPWGRENGL